MTLPVKPINQIEEKSEVSINDKILILDSVSEEARLASKDELKGDKGDKGDTGEQWPQGIQGIQWPKWDTGEKGDKGDTWATGAIWPVWPTWPQGAKWDKGEKWDTGATWPAGATWPQGETWPKGNWITTVTATKSWKTTTVTMNYDSWNPTVFQVQDWADWQGSGDMSASTYDPTGKMADAFDYNNMENTPDIPSTAADVWALPDSTKYWASLDLSINSTTYVITAQLKDQDWNNLWTAKTIDLPLESVVVSGSYDNVNKKVILTLKDGSTIEFSVADLVAGLQSEITSTNKLDSDLVDDTNQTHKFVTQTDKDTWDWKQDELVSSVNIRTINWTSILWSWDIVTPTWPTYSAWTGISLANDTISNTWVTSFNGGTWAVTYTAPVASVNWQTGAVTVEEWITKIFTLASTSDLTNAQAAYDRYASGGNPIIKYSYSYLTLAYIASTVMRFTRVAQMKQTAYWVYTETVEFTLSSWTVTAIADNTVEIKAATSAPTSWGANVITLVY